MLQSLKPAFLEVSCILTREQGALQLSHESRELARVPACVISWAHPSAAVWDALSFRQPALLVSSTLASHIFHSTMGSNLCTRARLPVTATTENNRRAQRKKTNECTRAEAVEQVQIWGTTNSVLSVFTALDLVQRRIIHLSSI